MSIASYIFVCSSEAVLSSEGQPEVQEEDRRIFYRVMNTSIESLYPVLTDGENVSLEDVWSNTEYTSWTFSFPQNFLTLLCATDASQVKNIISKWSQFEDCPYDNDQDLSDLVIALVELANTAKGKSQNLYFRMEM